jgi:hypothetical protein
LAQIAEKPITVATEEAISNLADSRQGRWARILVKFLRRPNHIVRSSLPECARILVAALNDDNDAPIG